MHGPTQTVSIIWAGLSFCNTHFLGSFAGCTIRVARAPEPSNILFLNLKYTKKQRVCRRTFTFLITYNDGSSMLRLTCLDRLFLVAISVVVVWLSQHYQNSIPTDRCAVSTRVTVCNTVVSECVGEVTREEAESDPE